MMRIIRRFDVMDKLNLYLFFVDELGTVEELSWKMVKEINGSKK
jgi:hypothetical protein